MTEEQIHKLAIALEVSFLADSGIGRGSVDLADQFMAALPLPDISEISEQRDFYARTLQFAADQGSDQQSIDYIRCKGVIIALEVAYLRGDLSRNWRN